jgi:glucokinase
MIVAGEVGPTETRLALCGLDVGRPIVVVEETAQNSGFAGLALMVQRFLRKYRPPQIRAAAFVVGGAIDAGVSRATGLPWAVGAQALASELAMDRVIVLSDVEGVAHALPALAHEDLATLNAADAAESGNQAVISAGVSPGVAGLYWNGMEHRSFASVGAFSDFAPSNEEELRLALYLSSQVERVTVELLLSRAGLAKIHGFTRGEGKNEDPALTRALLRDDPTPVILHEATTGADQACKSALRLFLGIYGSAAANIALTLGATGGVYLAGDLVPGLCGELANGAFHAAFCRKAPLESLLRKIPIHAVLDPKAPLLGAATVAARQLRAQRGTGWAS